MGNTKVVTPAKKSKAKPAAPAKREPKIFFGLTNDAGEINPALLKHFKDFSKHRELVVDRLKEMKSDLFIYGPKVHPEWDHDRREDYVTLFDLIEKLSAVIGSYSWKGRAFPVISKDHIRLLTAPFSWKYKEYEGYREDSEKIEECTWISLYHKYKISQDWLLAYDAVDLLTARDAIGDFLFGFREVIEDGQRLHFKTRKSAKMNGDYMEMHGIYPLKDGDPINLRYVDYDEHTKLLTKGALVAVASHKEEDKRKKHFSIGTVGKFESGFISLITGPREVSTIKSQEWDAIYLVTIPES